MEILDKIRGWREFEKVSVIREFAENDAVFDYLLSPTITELKNTFDTEDFIKKYNDEYYKFMAKGKNNELEIQSKCLKFFETKAQRSYLIAVKVIGNELLNSIICILDDRKKSSPEIKWRQTNINKTLSTLGEDLEIRTSSKEGFGLIDFTKHHKGWYYSKSIFKDSNIKSLMKEMYSWVDKYDNQ